MKTTKHNANNNIISNLQPNNKLNKKKTIAELIENLKREHAFWSYKPSDYSTISDDFIIEKVLIHLDIDDIIKLNKIFSQRKIIKVWKEKLIPQQFTYKNLNRFYAFWLFEIKNPDTYIDNYLNKYLKKTS